MKRTVSRSTRLNFEPLEARVLLDADSVAALTEPETEQPNEAAVPIVSVARELARKRALESAQIVSATQVVQFDFEASGFGGGPNRRGGSPGAPISRVAGSVTIEYDPQGLSTVRVTSFEVRGGGPNVGAESAAPRLHLITASDIQVTLFRPDGPPWAPKAMTLQFESTSPASYFSLVFQFEPTNPVYGSLPFVSASYRSGAQIYASRTGEVTSIHRSVDPSDAAEKTMEGTSTTSATSSFDQVESAQPLTLEFDTQDEGPPPHARREPDDGDGGQAIGKPSAPPGNPDGTNSPPRGTPGTPAPWQRRP